LRSFLLLGFAAFDSVIVILIVTAKHRSRLMMAGFLFLASYDVVHEEMKDQYGGYSEGRDGLLMRRN